MPTDLVWGHREVYGHDPDAERFHGDEAEERLLRAEKAVRALDLQLLQMMSEWTRAKDAGQRQPS